jgi:segregation and condensation protein B
VSDSAPGPTVPEEKLRLLFALLFSSPEPVNLDRIREVLYPHPIRQTEPDQVVESESGEAAEASAQADADLPAESDADPQADASGPQNADSDAEQFSPKEHLQALEHWMQSRDLPLVLHVVGRSWRLLTSEEVADDLISVRRIVHKDRLGPAALEVLSLVAYRQPILKADIDAVRGVKSGPHLRHLLDMRLVRILGRADLPGRPFLYGTTREFLDRFGLKDLKDLPEASRLSNPAEAPPGPPQTETEGAAAVAPESQPENAVASSDSEPDIEAEGAKIGVEQEN